MDFPLSYRPDGWDVLARLRALYQERRPDIVLASLSLSAPGQAFARFAAEHPAGYCEYPDPQERISHFWDPYLQERMAIRDDSVPSAYLTEMDQGLYGGLVGGDVRFLSDPDTGWISSMVPPLLQDWREFDRLSFSTDHPWWARYLHQLDVFAAGAAGKFGISHFILIDGLNFVFELVGATRTYLSLIDEPELVQRAIDLSYEINLRVQETFFERAPLLDGGTCSNMVQWLPGRDHLRERGSLPHDLGRLLRALGPAVPGTHLCEVRRRRAARPRQRPAPAGGAGRPPQPGRGLPGRRQGLSPGL